MVLRIGKLYRHKDGCPQTSCTYHLTSHLMPVPSDDMQALDSARALSEDEEVLVL